MSLQAGRLKELLRSDEVFYGVICRDATLTDIELYAQAGYHLVWVDLEHGALDLNDAMRLCRSVVHLGMVPVARIPELGKNVVAHLLDAGFEVLILPDVRDARQAAEFVRLGKFPPEGERGVSSTSASVDFGIGADVQGTLRRLNEATYLMVQVENDSGLANLESILHVDGIDAVTVGPLDWSVSQDLFGERNKGGLDERIDRVLAAARQAGKTTATVVSDPAQAPRYLQLGVRVLFVGVDVALKRKAFAQALSGFRQGSAANVPAQKGVVPT